MLYPNPQIYHHLRTIRRRPGLLDPCCGTGAYLVEVLRRIGKTLKKDKGEEDLANESERLGAGQVKEEKPILVILGNPPYNAFAGVSPAEEQGLVEPYKKGLVKKWGIKKFNLDEL